MPPTRASSRHPAPHGRRGPRRSSVRRPARRRAAGSNRRPRRRCPSRPRPRGGAARPPGAPWSLVAFLAALPRLGWHVPPACAARPRPTQPAVAAASSGPGGSQTTVNVTEESAITRAAAAVDKAVVTITSSQGNPGRRAERPERDRRRLGHPLRRRRLDHHQPPRRVRRDGPEGDPPRRSLVPGHDLRHRHADRPGHRQDRRHRTCPPRRSATRRASSPASWPWPSAARWATTPTASRPAW